MNCYLCRESYFVEDELSYLCKNCKLLINKEAKHIDYGDGGGQAVPSENKRKLRLENSFARFELIRPYMSDDMFFIDIGCGSGEMLEASKNYCAGHLGFDTNRMLIEHCKEGGLSVICDFFDSKYIDQNKSRKLIAVSHVIEHMQEPFIFVKAVHESMQNGDILFLEVPLYTGISFHKKGYKWNLWNDEHFGLYHAESLRYIADNLKFTVLESGFRNFIKESKDFGFLLKTFLKYPLKFIYGYLTKNSRQKIADNILQDYGYIVLEK